MRAESQRSDQCFIDIEFHVNLGENSPVVPAARSSKAHQGRSKKSKADLGSDPWRDSREVLISFFSNEGAESLVEGFAFLSHAPMDAEHEWCEGTIFNLENTFVITPLFLVLIG